jgi:hypothetical protein
VSLLSSAFESCLSYRFLSAVIKLDTSHKYLSSAKNLIAKYANLDVVSSMNGMMNYQCELMARRITRVSVDAICFRVDQESIEISDNFI